MNKIPFCSPFLSLVLLVSAEGSLLHSSSGEDSPGTTIAHLSNTALPLDTDGRAVVTGETSILTADDGFLYYYVNDWGDCPSVDCCTSPGGCASCCYVPSTPKYPDPCVFTKNHSVIVYRVTRDLQRWERLGVALGLNNRPRGIEFRPHVVYNARSKVYVMWYEDRTHAIASSGYFVATSPTPEGPFQTVQENVAVADIPGDFDIFVDDDGTAWHVQTTTNDPKAAKGFAVTMLDNTYTLPAHPKKSSQFVAPRPAEGPVFFKRQGSYYILGGTTCCACRGGSSVYVFRSSTPLGPWYYAGDVGANTTALSPFSKHDPLAYVTHAQASTVVDVNGQYVWLGNQWVTGATRNSDLLYWSVLNFDEMGNILQIKRSDKATIIVPSSSKASPTLPAIHDKKLKMQLKISIPTIALRGQIGHPIVRMPAMALGTAGYNDTIVEQAVLDAYANGFRAVHTAFDYFNAPGIARALRKLDRNEIFVIAMTSPCMHSASPPRRNVSNPQACTELTAREINATLKALNVKYVDLLLLHGPSEPFNYTGQCNMHVNALNQAQWAAYRDALEMGLAKSIGVSNFCQSCLAGLSPLPAINQIQWHVGMGPDPDGLVSWCVSRGIIVQAYSPLAAGAIVHDPLCTSVGKSIGHSSAEVGLRWVVQHKNTAVVVKSKNPDDMKNDQSVFGWNLSQDIVATLDRATEPKGQQDGRPSWGCGA